jgi:hypothetical protein
MKKNKVAIVGFSPHRVLAPYDDDSFEIWGINDLYIQEDVKRWDRWFNIHNAGYNSARTSADRSKEEYKKWDCPVYLWKQDKDIPNSLQFPFNEMVEKYGNYFNNTISWLIAFAMHEGFKEIHLYGVDMATHTEYGHQRPSCEYFIGLARGQGITVVMPKESGLLKAKYLYGLETERENVEKKDLLQRKMNVEGQMKEAERVVGEAQAKVHACQGAIIALDELIATL